MKAIIVLIVAAVMLMQSGCAMFIAWKSIPPPGGCEQCHSGAITADWRVAYQAPILSDERNREAFQTAEYSMPTKPGQPASSLELTKVQDLKCFECHRSPGPEHKARAGRFHH
jgi:hypothetical protein